LYAAVEKCGGDGGLKSPSSRLTWGQDNPEAEAGEPVVREAVFLVPRPPRFAVHPQRTSEGWTLNITGPVNKWVHLQRSGNLKDWEEIWSGFMWEANEQVNDADTGPGAMFYRVMVP